MNSQFGRAQMVSGAREAVDKFLAERIDYERMRMPYDPARIGLARMDELLKRLDRPDRMYRVVHVAGTKGKGSTSAMLAAALTAAGLKTGLYTSPHLHRVEERLMVDGQACREDVFVELFQTLRGVVEDMDQKTATGESGPTWFEIVTACALLHFARQGCQAAVLEVGLGGRLDATNVCAPQAAVITSISYDHTAQLGNTLELIAREKAGIVKPGVPTISGVVDPEAAGAIESICRERGSKLVQAGRDFQFTYHPPRHLELAPAVGKIDFLGSQDQRSIPLEGRYALSLIGQHQAANAATAIATIGQLQAQGWPIPRTAVQAGLLNVRWPARLEVVSRKPAVVIDGAHNVASIVALIKALDESFSVARRHLIFASSRDKNVGGMLDALLDRFDTICFTRFTNNPRFMPPLELQSLAVALRGRVWTTAESPSEAFAAVRQEAKEADLICVAGSLFLAGEMRERLALPSTCMQE